MIAIRPAGPGDATAIGSGLTTAFRTRAEADLVDALVDGGDVIVSLVADRGDEIVGHVLLSRMRVAGDGRTWRAVGLGPVGVLPGFQGAGIGADLIEAALGIARATGEDIVFVLGEPEHYRRFGFSAETAAPFASPYAGPYFMALALKPGFTLPASGEAAYAPAFSQLPEG
jgi:putative acetyltransferase